MCLGSIMISDGLEVCACNGAKNDAQACYMRSKALQLTFGPISRARTVSLCSHSLVGAVKSTQRMGTLSFSARPTQSALVSTSAFVLSGRGDQYGSGMRATVGLRLLTDHYTRALLNQCGSRLQAFLALFQQCYSKSGGSTARVSNAIPGRAC